MIPAIVLSSHIMGLSVIRALGKQNVPIICFHYEKHDMGFVSRYVTEEVFAPHPEKFEDKFIKLLLDYAERYGGSLLIPSDDATLVTVSKNKGLLKKHYIVACTDWHITEKFVDKKFIYSIAESVGVQVPKTYVPESLEEAEAVGKEIEFPCLIKPCQSHLYYERFNEKLCKVNNTDNLIAEYLKSSNAGIDVMIQEYIPGEDSEGVNYNSYYIKGRPVAEFTAKKVRLSPPESGVPRVVMSENVPEIIEPGRKILEALSFNGYSCIEFKKDSRNGVYKLMEVNGRYNRSGLLAVYAGINFPWIEYKHLLAGQIPSKCSFKSGIFWIDEFHDILNSAKWYQKERYPLASYIRPYIKPHIFAVFDINDFRPFFKRCIDITKIALQRINNCLRIFYKKAIT